MDAENKSFLLGKLGELAKSGISTIAQAQAQSHTTRQVKKRSAGCTPCAVKEAVRVVRAKVAAGKL